MSEAITITIKDKEIFERCCDEFYKSLGSENYISDLCFSNLLAWSDSLKTRRRLIHGFYCISLEFMGKLYHYAPLGGTKGYERVLDILCVDRRIELIMVPEVFLPVLQHLKNYKVDASYNANYSDYIYENASFVRLLNNPSNRYDYNHFKRHHTPLFQLIDEQNRADCLRVMEKYWCSRRDCSDCHFGCERKAIQNTLTHYDAMGMSGALVYLGNEPVAFTIAKFLNPEVIAYSFLKADTRIRGLQLFLLHLFARFAHKNAIKVNFTEDMGIEGLRFFKQRLAPFSQVNKYDVVLIRIERR